VLNREEEETKDIKARLLQAEENIAWYKEILYENDKRFHLLEEKTHELENSLNKRFNKIEGIKMNREEEKDVIIIGMVTDIIKDWAREVLKEELDPHEIVDILYYAADTVRKHRRVESFPRLTPQILEKYKNGIGTR
jgi:hypothetical protein